MDDALSRKFQHATLGRRDSFDEHAPPEDKADIERAEIMAKSHQEQN